MVSAQPHINNNTRKNEENDSSRIGGIGNNIMRYEQSTMYDMSRVNANGYFDSNDEDARYELRKRLNAQRTEDYRNGSAKLAGGLPDAVPDEAPFFLKDYFAYYKTERGYHPRSLNSNGGWNVTSALSFINMPQLSYTDEIRSAVLMIHGEKARSGPPTRNL